MNVSKAQAVEERLDVAVVGGGLCGVSLTRSLLEHGLNVELFEARPQLGGRIASVDCEAGAALDLGPTWYWPAAQPRMHALVEQLGLRSLPQHDPGDVLVLEQAGEAPKRVASENLHGGARRLAGGMARLLDALAHVIPEARVHRGHVLCAVRQCDDHVALEFERGQGRERLQLRARRVVLALPPRLVAEGVRFEPELDEDLEASLHATPTWMATAAKLSVRYAAPFWRTAGHSGNAFVQHEQAVLAEVFDACDDESSVFALGGFLALSPGARERYAAGLPMLMRHQIPQLFQVDTAPIALEYRDWAREPFTCSRRDLREYVPRAEHPAYGAAELTQAYWDGRLFFAGSESASREGGYLEGALVAAERVLAQLTAADDAGLALERSLAAQRAPALARYEQSIFRGLALASAADVPLTQRALLEALEPVFEAALRELPSGTQAAPELATRVRAAMRAFLPELVSDVLTWNRRSCALSNFPEEHRPSRTYLAAILHEVDSAFERLMRGSEPASKSR